jgi:hypothetical protein
VLQEVHQMLILNKWMNQKTTHKRTNPTITY